MLPFGSKSSRFTLVHIFFILRFWDNGSASRSVGRMDTGEDLASSVISEKFQEANKKIGDLQEEVRILKMKVEFLEQTVDGLKDKKINLLENTVWLMKEMKTMKSLKAMKAKKRRHVLKAMKRRK